MSRNTIKDIDDYYEENEVPVCPDHGKSRCVGNLCIDCDRCMVSHCRCHDYDDEDYIWQEQMIQNIERLYIPKD